MEEAATLYEMTDGTGSRTDAEPAMPQLERLRQVVAHAREQIPFYRDLWENARVSADRLESLADLDKFPIVRKGDLVKAGPSWVNPHQGRVGFSTRGTSGEPLLLWLSREEEEAYIAPTMRGFRWAGFEPGMTALLMSPVWHRLAACESHAIFRLGGRSAFFWGSMGPDYIDSFLQTLRDVKPEFLTTTAPFLLSVIRRADDSSIEPAKLFSSVRSISVVGLPLTPWLRQFLRDRLSVGDVFERAGTQEGAALDECRIHSAPHIHQDVCYLQVVDSQGRSVVPGVRGELVVTKLTTTGSTFVRYNTGDAAAFHPGPCACGCDFRRLKIYGRPESSIAINGRLVTAYDVRFCVEEDPALVGRNVLLMRYGSSRSDLLGVAIEGEPGDEEALRSRIRNQLEIDNVELVWLGGLRVNWGFRQIINENEIRRLPR
jgi:phenylacetate-CoA ligase